MPPPDSPVYRYHDGTKHHFNRFARSLGFLDWASQPRPFRSFAGARRFPLFPAPSAARAVPATPPVTYQSLFEPMAAAVPVSAAAVGDLLRHSLGLSAWKVHGSSRWSLRVNPSSGNLHPTEAYVVCGALSGLADHPAVYHYAADAHALDLRCAFDERRWHDLGGDEVVIVALSSIHWREAWKYGERAFRYCQHDLGHAIAAVTIAARMLGWQARLLPSWSHAAVATLTGIDRDEDFVEAEREEPGCLLAMTRGDRGVPPGILDGGAALVAAVSQGSWSGRASQLSEDHVAWTFIDDIAAATRDPGRPPTYAATSPAPPAVGHSAVDARAVVRGRRSAVALDGVSATSADRVFAMLGRLVASGVPWSTLWWTPRIHLLLFVHRVDGLAPGIYLFGRAEGGAAALRRAIGREMLDERAHAALPLTCLARGDCRSLARRLSCDQNIASEGFFSLGMIADFDRSLDEHGAAFYRHLFWESGVVGHMLYLEAEAAGVRGTGIGCFYDDAVHDVLGLSGHAFQSLYHFTIGVPVEDTRLTTEPGYSWEP